VAEADNYPAVCVCSVFQVDRYEMEYVLKKSGSDTMASRTDGENSDAVIRLRGLPFTCTKEEVANFFLGTSAVVSCFFRQA